MKADVLWIDSQVGWRAYMPDGTTHESAGILEICDKVEKNMTVPEGKALKWEAAERKFVCRVVDKAPGKLSKSTGG